MLWTAECMPQLVQHDASDIIVRDLCKPTVVHRGLADRDRVAVDTYINQEPGSEKKEIRMLARRRSPVTK